LASVSDRLAALAILSVLAVLLSCGPESRTEGRQRRLDTFRAVLPADVREAFDAIESESDCEPVGQMLTEARVTDLALDAAVDSIMDAELITEFSDTEIISFFWFYFAHAIETGTVPEP
jgi:hypothetical protein